MNAVRRWPARDSFPNRFPNRFPNISIDIFGAHSGNMEHNSEQIAPNFRRF